jgi:hypothetical protein
MTCVVFNCSRKMFCIQITWTWVWNCLAIFSLNYEWTQSGPKELEQQISITLKLICARAQPAAYKTSKVNACQNYQRHKQWQD